jgi:hypothetical protein
MKLQPGQIRSATPVDLESLNSPLPPPFEVNDPGAEAPFIAPRVLIAIVRIAEALAIAAAATAQLAIYPGFSAANPGVFYAAIIGSMVLGVPLAAQATWGSTGSSTAAQSAAGRSRPGQHLDRPCGGARHQRPGDQDGAQPVPCLVPGLGHQWFRLADGRARRHCRRAPSLQRPGPIEPPRHHRGRRMPTPTHAISALQHSHDTGITLLGLFDDRQDLRSPGETRGLRKLGNIDDLISYVRNSRVDTLIVTLPTTAEARLMQIVSRLWVLPVDIRLSAHDQKLRYRPRAYSYIGNLALLDLFDKPLGDWGPLLKAIEDRVIAGLALLLLSPVMALVALAVKLDSKGPVLFTQKRYGFNNELIEVYKFRSMYTDMGDANARKLVTKGDPRVTRVGRFHPQDNAG